MGVKKLVGLCLLVLLVAMGAVTAVKINKPSKKVNISEIGENYAFVMRDFSRG